MCDKMFRYLLKYVGTYRVLTELTTDGNFIMNEEGEIDSDYDELYISCKYGCKLKHTYKENTLAIFCPDKKIGKNIVSKFKNHSIEYTLDDSCEEYIIYFNDNDIKTVGKFMKLETAGKNLNPFGKHNYNDVINESPKKDLIIKSHTVGEPVEI